MNLLEFGRVVHSEMAAICDAARRGVAIQDCTLYTSTFPCHECAKHIVAAGIGKVVYVEPYPKSLVPELYPDSIALGSTSKDTPQVRFEPFVGIAPRQYINLFTMIERKKKEGNVVNWDNTKANVRFSESPKSYLAKEQKECTLIYNVIKEKKL